MTGLLKYRKNVASQLGEDGIIERIFEVIPKPKKWCVEAGAGDGFTLSNTYNLITGCHWSSVQIESSSGKFKELQDRYRGYPGVHCLNKKVGFEGAETIDNLLRSTPIPIDFDLLSLDIDGNDYHVWDSIKEYQPTVVIIEFNPTIPNHIEFVQRKDMGVYQGASLRALTDLGKRKGYELICATEWNGVYVRRPYYDLLGIEDNAIDQLQKDTQYQMDIFQLFDGTIVLNGCTKLLWHEIEIDQEQIQVLPKAKRVFPNAQNG
jgi:hypothetical protein